MASVLGLNDELEKLRQAEAWLKLDSSSARFAAAWEYVTDLLSYTSDAALREEAQRVADEVLRRQPVEIEWVGWRAIERGGNGRNGDGTWPKTDGRGCPVCGQIRGGGHGGGCENTLRYDENGNVIA